MKNLKTLSIGFAVAGLILGTILVGWFGFGRIVTAILSAGVKGFIVFCLWQLIVMAILGVAWRAVLPADAGRSWIFMWGRMVRDSASSCLPFSAVGGFVLGARAITLHGIGRNVAILSTAVDLTAEFVAEIAFAAAGLGVLLAHSSDRTIVIPAEIALGVALILGLIMMRLQRGVAPIFAKLRKRILGSWIKTEAVSEAELVAMYGHTGRVALCTAIHLLGWVGKGLGNWIGFWLLGAHVSMIDALAIEGLLHVMLAMAIFIPGYAGVQEAGYVGLGLLFGISPENSLSMSLLRRARDLAVGVPILMIWQFFEVRRLKEV